MSDGNFHVWAQRTRNFASGIEGRATKTAWARQGWGTCAGQLLPKQSAPVMTNARTKFTCTSRRNSKHPDGKEMRRCDVVHVERSLRRFSWSSSPQMLSGLRADTYENWFSLMLNQFSSVKIKPGCFQLAWENQDSHHGPHSCILELYKHRPGRKCLLLASLCYNRKCCCFLISAAHNLSMVSTVSHEDLGCEGPAAFSDLCPPADHVVLSHWKHSPNSFENELSFAMPWLKSCWLETSSNFPCKCFPSCCTHLPCTCFTLW